MSTCRLCRHPIPDDHALCPDCADAFADVLAEATRQDCLAAVVALFIIAAIVALAVLLA